MLVYLGGSISEYVDKEEIDKAWKWRKLVGERLNRYNIKCFNPMLNFQSNQYAGEKSIVQQNYYYLKHTDVMLVNSGNLLKSPGTIWEMSYCYFNHIPVYVFGDKEYTNIMHLRVIITEHFKSVDRAIERILNLYSLKSLDS